MQKLSTTLTLPATIAALTAGASIANADPFDPTLGNNANSSDSSASNASAPTAESPAQVVETEPDTGYTGSLGTHFEMDDQFLTADAYLRLRVQFNGTGEGENRFFNNSWLFQAEGGYSELGGIGSDDPLTLAQTGSEHFRFLTGPGFHDGDTIFSILGGYRHFTLSELHGNHSLIDVRNDITFGLQVDVEDEWAQYFHVQALYTGLLDDSLISRRGHSGDYSSLTGRLQLFVPISKNDEGMPTFGVMAGARYHQAWLNIPEETAGAIRPETLSLDAHAMIYGVAGNFRLGLGWQGSYGQVRDELGTNLDRFGRYSTATEDKREFMTLLGGFGHVEWIPENNISLYARVGYDEFRGVTINAGLQIVFGEGGIQFMGPGRQFSPSYVLPPEILDREGGGPGAGP